MPRKKTTKPVEIEEQVTLIPEAPVVEESTKVEEVKEETIAPVGAIEHANEDLAPEKKVEVKEEPKAETIKEIRYVNAGDQMMTLIHLYPCIGSTRTPIKYGNGKIKVFTQYGEKWSITVREFEQEFAPSPVGNALLEQRIIVVGDDCPAEVRERMGLDYSEDNLLTLNQMRRLMTMDEDEICELFKNLCLEHKTFVVKAFANDMEQGGQNCHRSKILKLNQLSKEYVPEGQSGMFADLLDTITRKEEQSY